MKKSRIEAAKKGCCLLAVVPPSISSSPRPRPTERKVINSQPSQLPTYLRYMYTYLVADSDIPTKEAWGFHLGYPKENRGKRMPTRDPAWPNHKVHPEERWGRVFFLRSDKTVRTTEKKEKKAGVRFSLEGGEEEDHGRSDRLTD